MNWKDKNALVTGEWDLLHLAKELLDLGGMMRILQIIFIAGKENVGHFLVKSFKSNKNIWR
jgi:hypothetical protein